MNSIPYVDDLVKEYLLFRGFTHTIKVFEVEKKSDKLKGFQVGKIIDQIFGYVNTYDINSLLEFWSFLNESFFARIDEDFAPTVKKLELSLKRYYVVYAIHAGHIEKVKEFFDLCAQELSQDSNWKSWFVLPYLKNPEADPKFSIFFTKTWVEAFSHSLHNFLCVIFQSIPLPKILNFNIDRIQRKTMEFQIESLNDELELLKQQLESTEAALDSYKNKEIKKDNITNLTNLTQNTTNVTNSPTRPSSPVHGHHRETVYGSSTTAGLRNSLGAIFSGENPLKKIGENTQNNNNNEKIEISFDSTSLIDANTWKKSAEIWNNNDDQQKIDSSVQMLTKYKSKKGPFSFKSEEIYSAHNSPISCIKFCPELQPKIASSSIDGMIRIWSLDTSQQSTIFQLSSPVVSLEWDIKSSNKLLICGNADGKIRIFNPDQQKQVGELTIDSPECPRVVTLASSPASNSFVASAISGVDKGIGTLDLWNIKSMCLERKLKTDPLTATNCVCFNHNGSMLFAGGADGMIRVYDIKSPTAIMGWKAHDSQVLTIKLSNDETSVFSAANDGEIHQWSIHAIGQLIQNYYFVGFPNDYAPSSCMSFDEKGEHFLIGSKKNFGLMYKVGVANPIQNIAVGNHKGPVNWVDWHSLQDVIVTGSLDNTISVLKL